MTRIREVILWERWSVVGRIFWKGCFEPRVTELWMITVMSLWKEIYYHIN